MPLFRRSKSLAAKSRRPFGVSGLHLQGQDGHPVHLAHLVQQIPGLGRGEAPLQRRDFLFQFLRALQDPVEALHHLAPPGLEEPGRLGEFLLLLPDQPQGLKPADRLDAPDARGNAGLGDDFHQTDVAGAGDVGAAAQFFADPGDGHQARLIPVLFLEKGHGALVYGLGHGLDAGFHRQDCATTTRSRSSSIFFQLLGVMAAKWAKSKRKRSGATSDPGLLDVPPRLKLSNAAWRMWVVVVAGNGPATVSVHFQVDRGAHGHFPGFHRALVDKQVIGQAQGVGHLDGKALAGDGSPCPPPGRRTRRKKAWPW